MHCWCNERSIGGTVIKTPHFLECKYHASHKVMHLVIMFTDTVYTIVQGGIKEAELEYSELVGSDKDEQQLVRQ